MSKTNKIRVTPSQIATIRVRPFKGSKKRPIMVPRVSLKKLQSKIKGLNRAARALRGSLRRTSIGDVVSQQRFNSGLLSIQRAKEGIIRYVENLQFVEEIPTAKV